jgi:hypothetical protein
VWSADRASAVPLNSSRSTSFRPSGRVLKPAAKRGTESRREASSIHPDVRRQAFERPVQILERLLEGGPGGRRVKGEEQRAHRLARHVDLGSGHHHLFSVFRDNRPEDLAGGTDSMEAPMQVDCETGRKLGSAGNRWSLQPQRDGVRPFERVPGLHQVPETHPLERPERARKLVRRDEEVDITVGARIGTPVELGRYRTL